MENGIVTRTPTTKCLNCGTEFDGNFCPKCGQSAETGRFTLKFIWENLLAALIGKDGGIWFTFKNLFSRPGEMIVEILDGKRKKYCSPFPMLFFTLTVYILIFSFTGSHGNIDKELEQEYLEMEKAKQVESTTDDSLETRKTVYKMASLAFKFYNNYYTAFFMLTMPLFLFATRTWYGKNNKKRYYRAEYIVAITYSLVIVVLYRCLASLMYLFSENASDTMAKWMPIVIVVAYTACFRKMLGFSIAKTAWRSLLAVTLYYLVLSGVILLISIIVLVYIIIK